MAAILYSEASLIAIDVCSINFLNLIVQIILQFNETREKGMCNYGMRC